MLAAVLVLSAVIGIAAGTAYDKETGSCSCGGLYINGICTKEGCNADTRYQKPDGSGSESSPYNIASAGNLYWFAEQANASQETDSEGNTVYTACAVLTADIVVNPGVFDEKGNYTAADGETAKEWSPICNVKSSVAYTGTFDGQDHSISGMYYNRGCEDAYGEDAAGLFGYVRTGGTVKNVTVQNSYFAATMYLGAVVGYNQGTVENCHGRGNYLVGVVREDIDDSGICIGGVVGANFGALNKLSNIDGAVSGKEYIGGVVGYAYGDFAMQNCYNTAPVTGTSAVGGVVGSVYIDSENTTDVTIRFCYNVGTLSGGNVGGIVGNKDISGYKTLAFRGCYYQQVAETDEAYPLSGVGNDPSAEGITAMSEEDFTSGKVAGQIDYEWAQYVNDFNAENANVKLKEFVWFADPATKLPAFDGDMVGRDGKIYGTRPSAGNGTAADPYQIDSYSDLCWFSNMLNGNHDYSLCAKMTGDIVANPGTFDENGNYTPGKGEAADAEPEVVNKVGQSNPYVGMFDGQWHTISGLYNGSTDSHGLFHYIGAGGTVKNVIIANSYFAGDTMGAIAAFNYGTVENCGVLDSVYFKAPNATGDVVGGVVGLNHSGGTVKNCFSAASVTSNGTCGGVVGKNDGAVTNCYFLQSGELNGIGVDNATGNTTAVADFSTGEATYKLNGDQSAIVWYQTLGTDAYPVLDATHDTVYQRTDGSYGNSATVECTHQYENGFCTACDAYQEPSKDADGTYLIKNAGNLYWFAAYVNAGNTGINAKLTADITVNKNVHTNGVLSSGSDSFRQWTPIGNTDHGYTGSFDGQDHTISGLYYNQSGSYIGLFGCVENGASIKNIGLIGSYLSTSSTSGVVLGGIVAKAYNPAKDGSSIEISGCYNEAVLRGTVSGSNGLVVGGIVGSAAISTTGTGKIEVENCHNTGSVSGTSSASSARVGGIVGSADPYDGLVMVTGCYNTGSVSGTGINSTCVGGVIGDAYVSSGSVAVSDCYNTGKLKGEGIGIISAEVGGIAGQIYAKRTLGSITISDCYNAGELSGSKSDCGGVVGAAGVQSGEINVTNCYFTNSELSALGVPSDKESISVDEKTSSVTADAVASGEVAYLLNKERSPSVWKQGKDGPAFNGDEVSYNSETEKYDFTHTYVDGVCKYCGSVCTHDTIENEICTICGNAIVAKVEIDGETWDYDTLAAAFAAASGKTATITLLRDTTLTSTVEIGNAKSNITLIGGTYTVSASATMFKITAGTLTVKSGTYSTTSGNVIEVSGKNADSGTSSGSGSSSGEGIYVPSTGIGTKLPTTTVGTVNIEGGSFTGADGYGLYVTSVSTEDSTSLIGAVKQGTANITGGTFSGSSYAVYVDKDSGAVTVFGGCGKLNVSGGTFGKLYVNGMPYDEVVLSGGTFEGVEVNMSSIPGAPCIAVLAEGYAFFDGDGKGVKLTDVSADKAGTVKLCTAHGWDADSATGKCLYCNTACTHESWDSATGKCTTCGYLHDHQDYDADGFCTVCGGGYEMPNTDENGTYLIKNAGNLYWFAKFVNDGNVTANAKLTDNITVNASVLTNGKLPEDISALSQWTPVGNSTTTAYKGMFDGDGHTISGLFYSGSDQYVGLFGCIESGATIQNVGVIDSCFRVSGDSPYLGGIVGFVYSYANANQVADPITISGCSSAALLAATSASSYGDAYCGGVVGYVLSYGGSVTIQNCSNTGELTAAHASVGYGYVCCGGVAGYVYTYNNGSTTIQNCFSTGEQNAIETSAYSQAYSGGVAGYVRANAGANGQANITLSNCYYTAASACGDQYAGSGAKVSTDKVERKTEAQFASGEVAWLLNGESSDDDVVWRQTLTGAEIMAVPGFTGQIVTYDSTTDTYSNIPVVSVTITWTSMEFTYTDGAWNANTHSYDDGVWSTDGGTVTIENGGNVVITASFGYVSTLGDVSGSFTKASFNLAAGASDTTALKLSGKPSTSLDNAAIGTITITIAQAKQGWQTENGATYYYVDGEKTTEWLKIDDKWYYFDADGAMKTGWLTDVAGYEDEWFYFDPTTGIMQTGWCNDITGYENTWFYFDPDTGVMQTGWVQDGNSSWYYFDTNGAMLTGWKQIGENWYYFLENGHMVTSDYVDNIWVDADGKAQVAPNVQTAT